MKLSLMTACVLLLSACAPLQPEPGMTFKDFNSKSALNMRGYLVPAGVYKDDGVARYETGWQKLQRERGEAQPENGWVFYYEKDGVMISEAELLALQEKRQRESQAAQSRARQTASSRGLPSTSTNQTNTNQSSNSSIATRPRASASQSTSQGNNEFTTAEKAGVCAGYHTGYAIVSERFGHRNDRDYSVDVAFQLDARYEYAPGYKQMKNRAIEVMTNAIQSKNPKVFAGMIEICRQIGAPAPLNTGR